MGEVVKCCNQVEVVGEGSTDYTLGDGLEEELGRSKQVEASFDKDEEDIPGKIGVVHRVGRVVDNNLAMAIVQVTVMTPLVQLSHSFLLYNI
jgi:hypothetical protein